MELEWRLYKNERRENRESGGFFRLFCIRTSESLHGIVEGFYTLLGLILTDGATFTYEFDCHCTHSTTATPICGFSTLCMVLSNNL